MRAIADEALKVGAFDVRRAAELDTRAWAAHNAFVHVFADAPRFDARRFQKACGLLHGSERIAA